MKENKLTDVDRVMRRLRSRPLEWVERFLPAIKLCPYQKTILQSLVTHQETWVASANGVGKTMTAALAALWFFLTRPSIVVTISPSADQLEKSLWLEIRHLLTMLDCSGMGLVVGNGSNLQIRRRAEDGTIEPRNYLAGRCVSKTESLQGVHLPRLADGTPTVLFAAEEATGIEDRFWAVVRTSAHATLAIANPIRIDGEHYRMCAIGPTKTEDGRPHRDVIRISGEDSPNVRLGLELAKQGLPLSKRPLVPGVLEYQTFVDLKATLAPWELRPRLFGLPNDEATAKLFPAAWLDFGQRLYAKLKAGEPDRRESLRRWLRWWGWPFGLGVDCAMGGGDLSAWAIYGRFGAVHVETLDTPNTRAIKRQTLSLMRHWRIQPEAVCFDRAIGKGLADELREEGKEVGDVGFGEGAFDSGKYPNMRVELYGELADVMAKAFDQESKLRRRYEQLLTLPPAEWRTLKKVRPVALPPDADLRQELFVLPRAQDGRDRLTLPPKDGSKSKLGVKQMLGGRSPDRADALVLARYAWERGQEHRRLSRVSGPLAW